MKKEHSIYDAIEKRQKNYFDAIEEHKRNLAKAEADRKKADAAMSDAVLNGNAAEWSKAKEALNEASDAIEFYKLQLSNAEKAPLFENVADRHRRRTEVMKHIEEVKAEKMKAAAKALVDAYELVNEVREEILKANDILKILEKNTGKNAALIDVFTFGTLCQKLNSMKDHTEIKPYV